MKSKEIVISAIHQALDNMNMDVMKKEKIEKLLEVPSQQKMGDYAFPCFQLSKHLQKAPHAIAKDLAGNVNDKYIDHVEAVGPYLNLFFDKQLMGREVIKVILEKQESYANLAIGHGENVTIDLSSPNIAKPFSMGHLRSTVIGNALANIMEKCGFTPIKINHIGDWGTQFGKLMVAYKLWGDEDKVKADPIKQLFMLYTRFHTESEMNPELDEQGRTWFKKLEDGDEEALSLWKWFRDESLTEFERIYQLLGIEFDSYNGEAFYNDKMADVVQKLEERDLLIESEGAEVVPLEEYNLLPCLIKKSDGATLYATRDLAAAIYRKQEYNFAKALYVVGGEQSLHFKQFFHVLKKMGYSWAGNMHHIPFGMMLKDGKKMSTRKGKVVLLEDVLLDAMELAKQNIEMRNTKLENKEDVVKAVGVGAVIFHDLKNFRLNDVEFSLESMLTFEGETGPYIQYTFARACSLLRKSSYDGAKPVSYVAYTDENAWTVISLLMKFEEIVFHAYKQFDPSIVAKYIINLAQAFNKYYGNVKILEVDEGLEGRLQLVKATKLVLKEGLRLLGLQAPVKM